MVSQRLLLFGDQTVEKLPSIQNLVRLSKASPLLRRFLREAIDIVQREVSYLSLDKRKAFIAFDDIVTLAEENAKEEDPDEVVATTLITIARLGELLMLVTAYSWLMQSIDNWIATPKMTPASSTRRKAQCICWAFVQVYFLRPLQPWQEIRVNCSTSLWK